MMISLVRRLRHEEDGYALVVAMLLLSIMMVSLVVALDSGSSAFRESEYGVRWARTLTVAESGIDNAMVILSESRTSASPCPSTGSTVCTTDDGQYQVDWTSAANGSMTITSTGYYPTKAALEFDRQVRVLLEPIPTFNVRDLLAEQPRGEEQRDRERLDLLDRRRPGPQQHDDLWAASCRRTVRSRWKTGPSW